MKIDLKDYINGREDLFTANNVVEMEECLAKFLEWHEKAINYSQSYVMRSPFLSSPEPAIIQDEFKAYEVSWKCQKGHINFQTILRLGTQNDICLKCGKHYKYTVTQDFA